MVAPPPLTSDSITLDRRLINRLRSENCCLCGNSVPEAPRDARNTSHLERFTCELERGDARWSLTMFRGCANDDRWESNGCEDRWRAASLMTVMRD